MNLSIKNKIFLLYILVIILTVTSIGYMGFSSASNSYINSALTLSKNKANTLTIYIEEKLSIVPKDSKYFANFYALQRYFIWKSIGEKSKVKKWELLFSDALLDFMQKRQTYYKVRIINNSGFETMAFTYDLLSKKAIKTPSNMLQDKSRKDYYIKSKDLEKGEFYISSVNLNEENNKIEVPYIPVIRYATPIIDNNGERHGTFVVNIFAYNFLDLFYNLHKNNEHDISYYLVDKNGNYIYNNDNTKLWAKQLKHGANFNKDFPFLLNNFTKDSDSFMRDDNIFAYKRMHTYAKKTNEFLYVISKINNSDALKELKTFKKYFLIITLLILIIGYFIVTKYLNKITAPLKDVAQQLRLLSIGEINDKEIKYTAKDEIGDLVISTKILSKAMMMNIIQTQAVANGDFTQKITLLGKNDKLGLAIKNMTQRLSEVASLADELSRGNYDVQVTLKSNDDKLANALVQMVKYLENITRVAESISLGNLNVKYIVKSDKDRLGEAVLGMTSYLKTVMLQANAISHDDFSQKIEQRSKDDDLGKSLLLMTKKLNTNIEKNKEEFWFSEGISKFNDELRYLDSIHELSTKAISLISRYISTSLGVLYIYDDFNKKLNLEATYSFVRQKELESFNLGEGLIGQVAIERKAILMNYFKNSKYKVQSGISSIVPNQTYTVPIIKDEELFAVIELANIREFTSLEKDYILKVSHILANIFYNTIQNLRIKSLLAESQISYEELQISSLELKKTNTQMESQALLLEDQANSLKDQNDKLEIAKVEIQNRAKELNKSNTYKSEFLANMSHELRTPLNAIILLSSLLQKNNLDNLNTKDIQKASVINKSGKELLRLIDDILDLSKVEAGKMTLIIDSIDSSLFLKSHKDMFEDIAIEKNLIFKVEDRLNYKFYNDKDRLSQVIKNLISNAFKFTKEGTVLLKIEQNNDNKYPIKISVSDTGIGIDKNKQDLIFKAFIQADGSTSREYGGTGLGLSISKELCSLMKAKIELSSIKDKGSTFTIYLPNLQSDYKKDKNKVFSSSDKLSNENEKSMKTLHKKENVKTSKLSNKNILIVDDDMKNIFVLSTALQEYDMNVFHAKNGKEAISIIKSNNNLDIVLMDIMMPIMDGYEAIKIIKEEKLLENKALIALSAKVTKKDKEKAFSLGADDYITKPIDLEVLVQTLLKHIEEGS